MTFLKCRKSHLPIGLWVLFSALLQVGMLLLWPVDFGRGLLLQPFSELSVELVDVPADKPPLLSKSRHVQSAHSKQHPLKQPSEKPQKVPAIASAVSINDIKETPEVSLAEKSKDSSRVLDDPSSFSGSHQTEVVVVRATPLSSGNVRPSYPRVARQRGWQGEVMLWVTVSQLGQVLESGVEKTSGYDVLDHSALRAVQSWRFNPASKNGIPVESLIHVPVAFLLERS